MCAEIRSCTALGLGLRTQQVETNPFQGESTPCTSQAQGPRATWGAAVSGSPAQLAQLRAGHCPGRQGPLRPSWRAPVVTLEMGFHQTSMQGRKPTAESRAQGEDSRGQRQSSLSRPGGAGLRGTCPGQKGVPAKPWSGENVARGGEGEGAQQPGVGGERAECAAAEVAYLPSSGPPPRAESTGEPLDSLSRATTAGGQSNGCVDGRGAAAGAGWTPRPGRRLSLRTRRQWWAKGWRNRGGDGRQLRD